MHAVHCIEDVDEQWGVGKDTLVAVLQRCANARQVLCPCGLRFHEMKAHPYACRSCDSVSNIVSLTLVWNFAFWKSHTDHRLNVYRKHTGIYIFQPMCTVRPWHFLATRKFPGRYSAHTSRLLWNSNQLHITVPWTFCKFEKFSHGIVIFSNNSVYRQHIIEQ